MEKKPTYEELEQRIRDLEREKNVEKRLCSPVEDQESMYRLILENISDAVIVTDNQGNMLYVCPNTTNIFGFSQDQVYKKKTIQRLMNGPVCNISELKNKHVIKGIEWSITNSYGKTLRLLINAKSVDINDGTVLYVMRDITDYKEFEKDLKKYKNIISSTLDGIAFLDENYRYIIVNDAYARFSGIDRSQLIGLTLSKYLGEDVFKNIIKPNFDRCLQGEVINYQEWFEHPSLGKRFFDITYFPYREGGDQISGVIADTRDITDRKNAEEEIDKQKSLFETMFHAIPDGVILTNTQREILSSNKKIESIFGYKQEELQGKSTEILYANQDQFRKTGTAVFDKNAKKPGELYVTYYRDKLGREFPGEILGARLFDKNNKWIGNLGILRDITGRKQMEEELLADLKFFENIDKVNRAFHGTTDFEQMLSDVLDVVLTIFDCDRASLIFPCDPDATSWSALMERTKPEWPGVLTLGLEVPMDPEVARIFRASRAADGPTEFGLGYKTQLPTEIAEQFNIQSQMTIALYPKTGQPWNFVLHQCSYPRVWTQKEKKLLTEIGRRMEDALTILLMHRNMRESETKYRAMMESMDEATYICSPDFRIEYMNSALIKKVGHDATGEHCFKAIHGLERQCDWCNHHKVMKGETIKSELIKSDTGEAFFISHAPIYHINGSVSKLSIYRDITEQKKMEIRIQQAQKMEAIGTLAGGIAHDFNNILFPIIACTEMLLDEAPEDRSTCDWLNVILNSAIRAKDLVQQILTFSRQQEQKLIPLRVDVIMKEALKLMRASLPSTIELDLDIPDDCGLTVADPTNIHQIIMNLCTNAYHAMKNTGGRLGVSLSVVERVPEDVVVTDRSVSSYLRLTVKDTGHGMEREVIERIFDPYYTTKGKNKGTGLGLAVVHGIVHSYGGAIHVESETGMGTVFQVYLPRIETEPPDFPTEPVSTLSKGHEKILLVDDEEPIIKVIEKMLGQLGYVVTSYTTSYEALLSFRRTPEAFDLVITDMTMPGMTGEKMGGKMLDVRPDIPIILCTGHSEQIREDEVRALGIKGFLLKPIQRRALAETIRKVLDERFLS